MLRLRSMSLLVGFGALVAQSCFAGAITLDSATLGTLQQPVQIGVDAAGNQYGQDLDITDYVGLQGYYDSGYPYGVLEVEVKGTPSTPTSQIETAFITPGSPGNDGLVRFETKQFLSQTGDFTRMFPTKTNNFLGASEADVRQRFYLNRDHYQFGEAVQRLMVRSPQGGLLITEIKVTLSDQAQP